MIIITIILKLYNIYILFFVCGRHFSGKNMWSHLSWWLKFLIIMHKWSSIFDGNAPIFVGQTITIGGAFKYWAAFFDG